MAGQRFDRIGGWLIPIVVVVGVLTPFGQLGSALALQQAATRLATFYGAAWPTYEALTLTIIGVRTVICLWVAIRLVRARTPSTPRLAIAGLWIAYPLLGAASLAGVAALGPAPVAPAAMVARLFWQVLGAGAATAYLLLSKRVAATYSQGTERSGANTPR